MNNEIIQDIQYAIKKSENTRRDDYSLDKVAALLIRLGNKEASRRIQHNACFDEAF